MNIARAIVALGLLGILGCPPSPTPPPAPLPKPPPAAVTDPAPVVDGDVTIAYENGLRIVVKRIPTAELVAMQLYIKGGAHFRTKENAGVEALALRTAVTGGTESVDKDTFSKTLSKLGSEIGSSSFHGYSVVAAKSLTEHVATTFDLMASAFLTPAMPDAEIELHRQRMLVGIKRREETPDGQLSMLVTKAVYAGHPYENLSDGTEESIGAVTPDAVRQHLEGLRATSRLELVVVGNVDAAAVRELVENSLAKLPRGTFEPRVFPRPAFSAAKLSVVPATLPTNYIEASFIGPSWSDADFAASILAMRILQSRLFEEVRTKRNLSYAPSARFSWGGDVTRGALYVTAVKANETMQVMLDEARRLQTDLVPAKVLAGAKSVFLTEHLMGNESTNGQASWLALCDIVGNDWRLSRSLPDAIKAVTAEQVRDFAKAHIGKLQTVVLGDPAEIDETLFQSL